MTQNAAPPWRDTHGGAASLRVPIIACRCQDEGVCIMCAECGHIFVASVPLSDESEQIDNDSLARDLYYHMCTLGRRQQKVWRGRK